MARFLQCLFLLIAAVVAKSTFSPARPPAIPLAVRSPYLSTWLAAGSDGGNGGYLAGLWPMFWDNQNGRITTGWAGLIRVDNTTYTWLGNPGNPAPANTIANQTAYSYTSTRSTFNFNVAGLVTMEVTFLSPVTPTDMMRQSFPVSYLSVEVQSADGKEHDVAVYTDISAEWTSGDRSQVAQWSYGVAKASNATSKRDALPEANPAVENTVTVTDVFLTTKTVTKTAGAVSTSTTSRSTTATSKKSSSTSKRSTSSTSKRSTSSTSKRSTSSTQMQSTLSTSKRSTSSTSKQSTSSTSKRSTSASSKPTSLASSSKSGPTSTRTTSTASSTKSLPGKGSSATGGVAYHKVWRQLQQEFSEENQQASWGYWYYATEDTDALTHQSGADVDVRAQFQKHGILNNTQDTDYRAINDRYPVFGFAKDLGPVGSTAVSTVFSINLAQDRAIQFQGYGAVQQLPSLWTTYHSDEVSAVTFYYNDYDQAASLATTLDNKVASDSTAKGGADYLTLTALAVRQAWGSLALVGNSTTQYMFMKEISSDGDIQTVDVIFPFFPILMYMSPEWMKMLLTPLFINQEAGDFTEGTYSEHDLGKYPNATKPGQETQPVEECGNMLIMSLAYAQRTGDTAFLSAHYKILNQWTQYLINDSLIPENQISTDDFQGSLANQTNLALKGIIGINAMAVIANLTGHASDGKNYTTIAHSYIKQWQTLGIAANAKPPHTTLAYGMNNTHGLLYNLWADALLQTNLVPKSVYEMQSNFYPTVEQTYGVALDTRNNDTKNDWEIFCAAIAEPKTSSMFIGDIAKFINQTPTSGPVTDLYNVNTGQYPSSPVFIARPVVGGWFALLALNETGIPSGSPS